MASKAQRRQNAKRNKPIMETVCKELNVNYKPMQGNSFHLSKHGFDTWHLYTGGQRVFKVGDNTTWATITSVEQFLLEKFTGEPTVKEILTVQKRCSDCMFITPQDELNKFGGKCEECFNDKE